MDLKNLKAVGGVVSTDLVKCAVTWEREGEEALTFDIFVRRLSFGDVERVLRDEARGHSRAASLIAAAVRLGDEGADQLSYDDAFQLKPTLAKAFANAVSEVNELGKVPPAT
jgi:hypothetical protein